VKLNPQQLETHVSGGLQPVYLLSGDEPLLVDEALAVVRAAAIDQGYTERERHIAERSFDWDDLAAGLQTMSLFAERRIIELRLPTGKPGVDGGRFLAEAVANPVPDTVIVVMTPKLDKSAQKTKWATSLAKSGVWVPLFAPDTAELPRWLSGRLAAAGLKIERDALQFLAAQVEGNLLAARQEIDKLALLAVDGLVTLDTVRTSVADGARFDVFQLGDAALAGKSARVARILYSLEKEGVAAPLVLWSLVRESQAVADVIFRMSGGQPVGQAMTKAGVWHNRQSLFRHATQGRDVSFAHRLVASASRTDRIVKGSLRGQPWNALLELAMMLAGVDDWRAEIV
jgi:DNA polymerase-3 subunit delta